MNLPSSFKNWISISGAVIAIFNLASILSLFLLNVFFNFGGTYIGIIIYMILPVFLIFGLLLIPIGMRIYKVKERKAKAGESQNEWPIVDFNNVGTRNASVIFIIGTVFLIIISSVGSYEAFHYTESVEFCGKLCHQVMEPEYTTYHGSSHERVACVECHVGSGASWYVKSKLSGLYQVYSVLANKYPKPIPTPIDNLRPAQETCEKCHWPEKFYDRKLKIKHSFLADEANTEQLIHLQIKTSSKSNSGMYEKGIHQHINPDVLIEYKTTSANRQNIPWVRYTNKKTGESEVYLDSENMLSQHQLDSLPIRKMDCLDCHNRPSHNYNSPQNFFDLSMSEGRISKNLPNIKQISMQVLNAEYPDKASALKEIESKIMSFYKENYPELTLSNSAEVAKAIAEVQEGYSKNIFPFMKVNWKVYPNNLGHLESDGCYRCHNERHATTQGKVISKDCNLCHNIIAQGTPSNMEYSKAFEPLDFKHPVDIDDAWKTENCSMCHSQLY